jgi:hypothetical protein
MFMAELPVKAKRKATSRAHTGFDEELPVKFNFDVGK